MEDKVVVAEEIAEAGIVRLRQCCEVDLAVGVDRSELLQRLADASGLVVRSATRVDAEMIAAAPGLKVIGRAGIGVDNIDIEAATKAGVLVVNAPAANAMSAAEHTMALLLSQARRVPEADRSVRAGGWERKRLKGVELYGKTLGVVGLGQIGTIVAQRGAAFGMKVIVYDPFVSEDRVKRAGAEARESLAELLAESDFVTIHVPRNRETESLIDAEALAAAKPGVRIVNTSRGGIVDEAALADAVRSGRVAGAALDVFATEPPEGSPLFELPEVVLTPHLGASTVEAQDKAGTDVAASVAAALRGELVPNAVNLDLGHEIPDELIPFLPVAEHLAAVFVVLAQGLPEELSVRVEGRLAESNCKPLSLAVLKSALSRVSAEHVTYVNALALAGAHGISLVEEYTSMVSDYVSVIRLSGVVGGEVYEVSGTLVGRKGPALVGALDHEIELPLSANTVLLLNKDVPGVIGRVGTYLGELGVNIGNMVVGRSHHTGAAAAMGLNVDRPLLEEEVEGLRQVAGIAKAWFVDLS